MAEDRDKDPASLEPPSLFRRRKGPKPRRAPEPLVEAEPASSVAPPVAPHRDDSPATIFDDASEPTAAQAPSPVVATRVELPEEPRPAREPWLGGTPAAALTGLLVGALIVAATAGALRICTAVKGTSSCGGQGFFLLVAILIVAVLVGAALLRGAAVPEPGSTSFLAVGLLSVIALLFLVGSIFEWWMVIVIPLASVATFLLSYWVTTTFVDTSDSSLTPEEHDVR